MRRSTKRLAALIAVLPVLLLLFAWLYMMGMNHLEENPRDFTHSLEWAAETITTTGYGKDAEWTHPAMSIFVIVVQFAGVFMVSWCFRCS